MTIGSFAASTNYLQSAPKELKFSLHIITILNYLLLNPTIGVDMPSPHGPFLSQEILQNKSIVYSVEDRFFYLLVYSSDGV